MSATSSIMKLISVTATGTFFPDSPYGSFFYGIHASELAVELAGGDIEDVSAERAGPGCVVVRCRVGAVDVAVRLVPPATPDEITFHVEAVCENGLVESVIGLGDDYMAPVVDRFLAIAVDPSRRSLVFHCHAVGGELEPHPLECLDVGWFARDALPEPLASGSLWVQAAFDAIDGKVVPSFFDAPRGEVWNHPA